VNNELAVANSLSPPSMTVYALTANGNVAPLRTISGAATGLTVNTVGLAVDTVNNEFFVAIGLPTNSVLVFARTANGNVAPLRTISGAATGLNSPYGVAVDIVNNEVAVTNLSGNSVTVYARTANGNVAPLRTISGAATGLNSPTGLAVDTVNNELVAANIGSNSVTVHARTANGNVAPLRTISGAATGISGPFGLAVDTVNNELAVVNFIPGNSSVTVYARTANGNVAPLRTLQGAATGFNIPLFVGITTGGGAPPTPTSPPGTSTPTPTSPPGTPTPTSPPGPTSTPLPGGVVVPTLDVRGQIALMLILAAIAILAIRRMSS
jgi:DNA-binding beta-propeller fold protein YncE